jgi:hypothetical protein
MKRGFACLAGLFLWTAASHATDGPDAASLDVNGEPVPYAVFAFFPLPGEAIRVVPPGDPADYRASATSGQLARTATGWSWHHDEPGGPYPLVVRGPGKREWTLNLFVRVPASELVDGRLEGYRIGEYPEKPLKGLAIYRAPEGFVRVTRENAKTPVSPHFTLGEFLAKQVGGYPKFLVLKPRLVLKLERLLEEFRQRGVEADRFHIMSGYRTPHYNKAIGNVAYSRHIYGGAADIFIDDNPRDGRMDDIDGNLRVDVDDARSLSQIVEELAAQPPYQRFVGGLGVYKPNSVRGPFIHVDVRGSKARWGAIN